LLVFCAKEEFNWSSSQPGAVYGLAMILNADQSEYLVTNSPAAGFRAGDLI